MIHRKKFSALSFIPHLCVWVALLGFVVTVKADGEVVHDKSGHLELASETNFGLSELGEKSLEESARKRNPKYAFNFPSIPNIPVDTPFAFDINNITGITGVNGSGNPFDPILTSVLLAKAGIFSLITAAKTILPPIIVVGVVILAAIAAGALLICTFTECPNLFPSNRPSFFEDSVFKRNSYEQEPSKFHPIYQALDEDYMKYKYTNNNQITPGKTY